MYILCIRTSYIYIYIERERDIHTHSRLYSGLLHAVSAGNPAARSRCRLVGAPGVGLFASYTIM